MAGDDVAATLHKVGVNFGDHGETVLVAVEVDPDETVQALVDRLIPAGNKWRLRDYEHFITLRLVQPAAEPDPDIPAVPTTEPF